MWLPRRPTLQLRSFKILRSFSDAIVGTTKPAPKALRVLIRSRGGTHVEIRRNPPAPRRASNHAAWRRGTPAISDGHGSCRDILSSLPRRQCARAPSPTACLPVSSSDRDAGLLALGVKSSAEAVSRSSQGPRRLCPDRSRRRRLSSPDPAPAPDSRHLLWILVAPDQAYFFLEN